MSRYILMKILIKNKKKENRNVIYSEYSKPTP